MAQDRPLLVAQLRAPPASAILGKPVPCDSMPWFWSDRHEIKLQITGLLDGYDACGIAGHPAEGGFSVEYRKAGKLVAVDAINDGRAHMLGRRRIAADLPEFADASEMPTAS